MNFHKRLSPAGIISVSVSSVLLTLKNGGNKLREQPSRTQCRIVTTLKHCLRFLKLTPVFFKKSSAKYLYETKCSHILYNM